MLICLDDISRFTLHLEIYVLLSHMQMNKCGETETSDAREKARRRKTQRATETHKTKKMKSASMAKYLFNDKMYQVYFIYDLTPKRPHEPRWRTLL